MNKHYFHFINKPLSLKLKAHFAAKVFQMTYKKACIKGFYEFPFKSMYKKSFNFVACIKMNVFFLNKPNAILNRYQS